MEAASNGTQTRTAPDKGIVLLAGFTVGLLVVTLDVVALAVINTWWALGAAMVVHLLSAAAAIGAIWWLMSQSSEPAEERAEQQPETLARPHVQASRVPASVH